MRGLFVDTCLQPLRQKQALMFGLLRSYFYGVCAATALVEWLREITLG